MAFEIIDNIAVPAAAARSRARSALTEALDGLQVGQGFYFDDKRDVKKLYPSVSPTKFPSGDGFKKFKLWQEAEGKIGVKRMPDITRKVADEDTQD